MDEERDTRNWEALKELGRTLPGHEERIARAWAGTVRAMARTLQEDVAVGARGPAQVAAECQRLINHRGCPDDARELLEDLLLTTQPLAPLD